ncbi:MAG: alpha/beta fold hydrolase [Jiangellaceae bacterium]
MTTSYLKRPQGRIAYDVTGAGPLVVRVPGMGDLRSAYRFLVPLLVDPGYRIATMDLRGHGDSDTGFTEHDGSAAGSDVLALIEELGGRATVIGNSLGAAAGVWAAAERPDLVNGVALLGPFVRDIPVKAAIRLVMRLIVQSLRRSEYWREFVATTNSSHAAAEARLGQVRVPALVLMGGRDPDFPDPAAEAQLIAQRLGGGADVVMVADAGHYPQVEYPETVGTAITALLERVHADA